MAKLVTNIMEETLSNENFRKVLTTNEFSQLVVMSLQPGEEIGTEIHNHIDQFIRIEQGTGQAILDGETFSIADDFAIVIPGGTEHNIINTSETEVMKLYIIYSPAEHADGTIHKTKAEADAAEHHH